MSTLGRIFDLFSIAWREDRRRFGLAMVLMLLQSAAAPLTALGLGAAMDAAVAGDEARAVAAGVFVAASVIAWLTAGHFAHIFYFELSDMTLLWLERRLLELSNGSPALDHHERPDYADKLQVLRQEIGHAGSTAIGSLLGALGLVVAIVLTAVLLALVNPWLLCLPIASLPPLVLGRRAEDILARAREAAAPSNRRARHLLQLATDPASSKELRVCSLERALRARHGDAWSDASRTLWRGELRALGLRVAGQLIFSLAYVGATLLVVWDAVSGQRSVGSVVLAITLAAQVNHQVTTAVTLHHELQRVARALADMRWIESIVRPRSTASASPPSRLENGIVFENVAFSYPQSGRGVLEGVNLRLAAGSTVAIVGENGAGKTTLVKLLCGFYPASAGAIYLDGADLRSFAPTQWRQRIAAGFQDFVKFEFLARETVGLGHLPDIGSDDAVLAALRRAQSDDVLSRLDRGLSTPLGKSLPTGTELSIGQWQKLALGRAMMRERPLLLILDEPTSALDARAEHVLFEQYAAGARRVSASTGAITVLVSHRFSTVRTADQILVVADGRIGEVGTHAELMRSGGLYSELYSLQARAYQ